MLKFFENMEAESNKDHNKSEGKNMAPSCDFSHIGMNSP